MNIVDDKLYARTEKFINNMNNLLLRIKGEATKAVKKQTNKSNVSEGQLIGAIVLGVAVGAVASLLLAPSSGKDTRNKLANNFKDVSKKVTDWEEKQGDKLNDLTKETEKNLRKGSTTV